MSDGRLRTRVPIGRLPRPRVRPGAAVERAPAEGAPGAVARLLHRRSARPSTVAVGASLVRVYWHVTHAGRTGAGAPRSPAAQRGPSRRSGSRSPTIRSACDRCDAAVLYLPARRVRRGASAAARGRGRAARRTCGRAIPAFTLELAPGVGLAEDERRRRELRRPALRAARRGDRRARTSEGVSGPRASASTRSPTASPRTASTSTRRIASRRSRAAMSSDGRVPRGGRRVDRPADRRATPCGTTGAAAGSAPSTNPTQPWRPKYRALGPGPLRRHGGRRPVPRAARRADRRRGRPPDRGRSAAPRDARHALRRPADGLPRGVARRSRWAAARAAALLDEDELGASAAALADPRRRAVRP